ncbi:hypothetical protein [Xylocopilactobacillus apicola]|uniref:Uncharacterized protein n=1 Tax=Xylocopilactobacillus apicola TaxID=2932184 RepID=A0AAU9D5U7_9LACO|nr:hypothetical protein [Xylocopilactobacillus apicola]BDR57650.1 hypothetical protein XA3_00910 [Xylocopilactobacillus apicola]
MDCSNNLKLQSNPSVIIESLESKKYIFNLALSKIPNSFAEAVVDIFLEDNDFFIDEISLISCVKNGTLGLRESVLYRNNVPEYIRDFILLSDY